LVEEKEEEATKLVVDSVGRGDEKQQIGNCGSNADDGSR
jgi:hypothetical protein